MKKKKDKEKYLKLPKIKVKEISPEKVYKSFHGQPLVREGRTGYFNEEYEKERKWLS